MARTLAQVDAALAIAENRLQRLIQYVRLMESQWLGNGEEMEATFEQLRLSIAALRDKRKREVIT